MKPNRGTSVFFKVVPLALVISSYPMSGGPTLFHPPRSESCHRHLRPQLVVATGDAVHRPSTATNFLLPHTMAQSPLVVPDWRSTQVNRSVEVSRGAEPRFFQPTFLSRASRRPTTYNWTRSTGVISGPHAGIASAFIP